VEQTQSWLDAMLDQLRNHIIVMLQARFVDRPLSERENSGPCDTGRVVRCAEVLQPLEVLLVQIVMLGKDVPSRVIGHLVHVAMGEQIPDGWSTALVLCGAFKPGAPVSISPFIERR
jgi:hypothetical protein